MGVFLMRLLKGAILFIWIIFLVYSAGWAARGKASIEIINFFENPFSVGQTFEYSTSFTIVAEPKILSGSQYLRRFKAQISVLENPVPISPVLDRLIPGWESRYLIFSQDLDIKPDYVEQEHYGQFSRIEQRLLAVSANKNIDPKSYKIGADVISQAFGGSGLNTVAYSLPLEVVAWIEEDRRVRQFLLDRAALIDTFLLLIVLGALGSLIFLTRDYISLESATGLAAYFFRPILGMFLAMAMFILDILAHAVISEAGILEVRAETLYVLAFAAGLLSEQAYSAVSTRAQAALVRFQAKYPVAPVDGG